VSPLVFRRDGFRVFFYSNEGDPREPVHVHVRKAGAEAKVRLQPEPAIARSHGFSAREQSAILAMVREHRAEIERAWHEHFGD